MRIVVWVDDNLTGLDHFLVFVLFPGRVVAQRDVEILDVDVLKQTQLSTVCFSDLRLET